MVDYEKEVIGSMKRTNQLISMTLRYAIETGDLDGLEDRIEGYFDQIRKVVRNIRSSIVEEMYT